MDFSADYPDSTFDPAEYIVTAKLKVHKEASLLDKNSITASGRNVIKEGVCIHSDLGAVIIAQDTVFEKDVSITPSTNYINEKGQITPREKPFISIGQNVIIQHSSSIRALRIGDNVLIGAHCVLGEGCVIMDNCVLDDNTEIPPYSIVAPFSHMGGAPGVLVDELPFSFSIECSRYCREAFDHFVP
ncbi:hypothetical protein WA556_004413, partial [Blastocystis sp. ATCC 50177/Nand II]